MLGEDTNIETANLETAEGSFSVLQLVFSLKTCRLEKGLLAGGVVKYTSIGECELPINFTPDLVRNEDNVKIIAEAITNNYSEVIGKTDRISIVLPQNWGFTREVSIPAKLPDEEKTGHLIWTLKTTGWQDDEPLRYNYRQINADLIFAVAIRERIFIFVKNLAQVLSGRLVRLSLATASDVNIISEAPEPQIIAEKIEEVITEKKSDKKVNIGILILILLIIGIGFAGYYLYFVKHLDIIDKFAQRKRQYDFIQSRILLQEKLPIVVLEPSTITEVQVAPADSIKEVVQPDTIKTFAVPVDTAKPPSPKVEVEVRKTAKIAPLATIEPKAPLPATSGPFSGVFARLDYNAKINFLSLTVTDLRCELLLDTKSYFDSVLIQVRASGYIESAAWAQKGVFEDKLGGILFCKFKPSSLSSYQKPVKSEVESIFKSEGIILQNDSIFGDAETILTVLSFIDRKHLLFYRLIIEQAEGKYKLTMQY